MTAKSRADLQTQNTGDITSNGVGGISGSVLRVLLGDVLDSHANLTDDFATAAQIRMAMAAKLLNAEAVYQAMEPVTLTDAPTIAMDMNAGITFTVTIAANRTLGNPTNVKVGKSGVLRVVTSGADRTLGVSSNWKTPLGEGVELSAGSGDENLFSFLAWSATKIYLFPAGTDFF